MKRGTMAAAALVAAALAPAGAHAATVSLDTAVVDQPYPQEGTVVRYDAAPGERNQPTITYDQLTRTVRVTDGLARLQVGSTPAELGVCTGGAALVVCVPEPYPAGALVRLGDGDDAFAQGTLWADVDAGAGDDVLSGTSGRFAGGDGDDDLTGAGYASSDPNDPNEVHALGGAGNDRFRGAATANGRGGRLRADGGAGNDVLLGSNRGDEWTGGTGADASNGHADVSYAGHPAGVTVKLDGLANDGAPGEGDDVRGAPYVVGSAFADTLHAGGDDAWLRGGAGDDTLKGGSGFDTLEGGTGDDTLDGGGNWDRVDGGTGGDDLTGGAGGDDLHGGDALYPGYGDVFRAVDGEADRIHECGVGPDTAFLDPFDTIPSYGISCTTA